MRPISVNIHIDSDDFPTQWGTTVEFAEMVSQFLLLPALTTQAAHPKGCGCQARPTVVSMCVAQGCASTMLVYASREDSSPWPLESRGHQFRAARVAQPPIRTCASCAEASSCRACRAPVPHVTCTSSSWLTPPTQVVSALPGTQACTQHTRHRGCLQNHTHPPCPQSLPRNPVRAWCLLHRPHVPVW